MRKGWPFYSIAIGVAAALIAYVILSLLNTIYWGQSQLLDQLSKDGSLGSITSDMFTLTNSPFFLAAIALLLLELLAGMVSFIFTRPADGKREKTYAASMLAGLFPAMLWGIFAFNNWLTVMSQIESHSNVRPVEPSPEFIVIGLICFEMVVCLLASAAGGWLAKEYWVTIPEKYGA
jgi:hypothetical protein